MLDLRSQGSASFSTASRPRLQDNIGRGWGCEGVDANRGVLRWRLGKLGPVGAAPGRGVAVLQSAVVDGHDFVAWLHQLGGHCAEQCVANHLWPRACIQGGGTRKKQDEAAGGGGGGGGGSSSRAITGRSQAQRHVRTCAATQLHGPLWHQLVLALADLRVHR